MMVLANMGRFGPGMGVRGHMLWPWAGLLLWLLMLGLLALVAVLLIRRSGGVARTGATDGAATDSGAAGASSPLDVAKMRYARGELTKEEFEALKADLE
jgi:putative membrane protein